MERWKCVTIFGKTMVNGKIVETNINHWFIDPVVCIDGVKVNNQKEKE